jgi:hypothetical protein
MKKIEIRQILYDTTIAVLNKHNSCITTIYNITSVQNYLPCEKMVISTDIIFLYILHSQIYSLDNSRV